MIARSVTVILPDVNVPVLSLHSTLTQPSVSMASIFLTRTFRFAICRDEIIKEKVTVGMSPSGTNVKKAVDELSKTFSILSFCGDNKFATNERRPVQVAVMAIRCTKCSICTSKDDLGLACCTPLAILPSKVSSPVAKTTPTKRPSTTLVPEKRVLLDSSNRAPSGICFWLLGSATLSPVSAELSTKAVSVIARMRTSAGTRWPASKQMTSPGRSSSGVLESIMPILQTDTCSADCICCKEFIIDSACCSVHHCSNPAMVMTVARIPGVTRSASSAPMKDAKPISTVTQNQSKELKTPPKTCLINSHKQWGLIGGSILFKPNFF
mmetsp:Transcript_3213/g.7558  ORF Transcript_3213/g.7558 Transcript_3213/m.7558 type:complete len:324 (-) Transcript_3213:692-1663(-)